MPIIDIGQDTNDFLVGTSNFVSGYNLWLFFQFELLPEGYENQDEFRRLKDLQLAYFNDRLTYKDFQVCVRSLEQQFNELLGIWQIGIGDHNVIPRIDPTNHNILFMITDLCTHVRNLQKLTTKDVCHE